jgi:hypothetical protein
MEIVNMALGVQSYPELYTTLLGWQMYDQIWDLLSETGLAFLPFIGIVLRNIAHPYTSQETKDAGSTSLRRMEVDFVSTLLLIFFAVSPAFTLAPSVLYYTPLCQTNGQSSSYHPGNTGTTYDQAFTVPTGDIRVPIWWYAVIAFSEGITSGANTLIACSPDLRKMTSQVAMAKITDPALKQEVQEFEQECFIPARTQYLADVHSNNPILTPILAEIEQYGENDTEWPGSHAFSQTYYQGLRATQPVKGFPYQASGDINADTNADHPPDYGTPTCDVWWNDSQYGLKNRLKAVMPINFWADYDDEMQDENTQDDVLKEVIFSSQTGYDKASNMVGDVGYSHVATALGTWFHQLDQYPKLYAAEESAPIIQALLLMMVYTFLPLALVFTSYRTSSFISGAIIIFSLIFWTFIWHIVSWTDSALMTALYGDSWFSHQSPNATLVDMMVGVLIIVAPLFWFSFMGSMGMAIGGLVSAAFNELNKPSEEAAKTGSQLVQNSATSAGKLAGKTISKMVL